MALTESAPVGVAGLTRDRLRAMYRDMLLSRLLDQRMLVLNRQGRAPFAISGQGHEAAQVGVGYALRRDYDWVIPYYRDISLVLVMGMEPRDQLLAALAKAGDPNSGARQMPAHYSSRKHNIVTGGSPVATQILHAVGVAQAFKYRKEDRVVVASVGEGGTSEGDWHEGLNWAAIHQLPVIFLVENNSFAISVPQSLQMAVEHVSERAAGYGMPGQSVDGGDVLAVYRAASEAVDRARRGGGPTLLEAACVRLQSHSSDDDQRRYRSAEDLEEMRRHDPLERFRADLESSSILTDGEADQIRQECQKLIDEAQEEADQAPAPDPSTALQYVYGEGL
ncbi:MAG TPA: thiamine pyrophosphate-dependent dehydrogenase E1 component subunit alpha [Candidatus Dormibacteraeota bacterium]|nr:thiamine pyrophosphate-dependent dehydrogenase E1 component subunit alpha [Candidatus Dormibacteraeota bacterium]